MTSYGESILQAYELFAMKKITAKQLEACISRLNHRENKRTMRTEIVHGIDQYPR